MNLATRTIDTRVGTVAEIDGKLIEFQDGSSPTVDQSITLYPSIVHQPFVEQVADYTFQSNSSPSSLETHYQKLQSTLSHHYQEKYSQLKETAAYRQAKAIYDQLQTTLKPAYDRSMPTYNDEELSPIQSMAWHPHQDMLAVADRQDQVYIYQAQQDSWSCYVLEHPNMKAITVLEWKERAAGVLAVGCKQGVCVWTIPQLLGTTEPQLHPSATMQYLTYPDHHHISSLAWDPTKGSHLLAVGSANSNTLVIFDLLLNRTNPLKRYGHGTTLLRWSPDGEWLFETGCSVVSRMWDTKTWESKSIQNPSGLYVQAACWAPDNRCLIFSMFNKSDVHILFLGGRDVSNLMDHQLASFPPTDLTTETGEQVKTGGIIRDITVDQRNGQRLAIAFKDSPLIGLYLYNPTSPLSLTPQPILFPIGYIQGASHLNQSISRTQSLPLQIRFSKSHGHGTVMAILWQDGLITFVTHHYMTEERKRIL